MRSKLAPIASAQSPQTMEDRSARPHSSRFFWATAHAARDRSTPRPWASGTDRRMAQRIAPDPVPRSRIRGLGNLRLAQKGQRRVNEAFRVRPWVEHVRSHHKVEAVKPAAAEDPRYGFVLQAPLQKCLQPRRRTLRRTAWSARVRRSSELNPVAPSRRKRASSPAGSFPASARTRASSSRACASVRFARKSGAGSAMVRLPTPCPEPASGARRKPRRPWAGRRPAGAPRRKSTIQRLRKAPAPRPWTIFPARRAGDGRD